MRSYSAEGVAAEGGWVVRAEEGSRSGVARVEVLNGLGWRCRVGFGGTERPQDSFVQAMPTSGRVSSSEVRVQSKLDVDSAACS